MINKSALWNFSNPVSPVTKHYIPHPGMQGVAGTGQLNLAPSRSILLQACLTSLPH